MKICKNCGIEHNNKGDFCSSHCQHSYAGKQATPCYKEFTCKYCGEIFLGLKSLKAHSKECSQKPLKRVLPSKEGGWDCNICGQNFRTREELSKHRKEHKEEYGKKHRKAHSIKKVIQIHKKISFICKYCGEFFEEKNLEFKSRHENYCKKNPNAKKIIRPPCTEEQRKKMSEIAKRNHFGGWHTSKRFNYNGIILDSTYEIAFAIDLDKHNIKWKRPEPLYYVLNGERHRYYPDFYLLDFDVYVDTKNDFLINNINPRFGITDLQKINLVEQQNNVKIFVLGKKNLSWADCQLLLEGEPLSEGKEINRKELEELASLYSNKKKEKKKHLSDKLKEERWEIIKNSGIDFSKFGWGIKLAKLFGISSQKARLYVKEKFPDFYKNCK